MSQLEALEAVTSLSFLPNYIQDTVNKLCSLGIVTLCPIVASSTLSEYKVVRPEDLTIGTAPHRVHGARLQVNQHCPRHILPTRCFVVIDIDPLQLQPSRVASERSSGINSMLVTDDLPELGTDLVSALASLHMNNLPHVKTGLFGLL